MHLTSTNPFLWAAAALVVAWAIVFSWRLYYMYFWLKSAVRREPFKELNKLRRVQRIYGLISILTCVLAILVIVFDRLGIVKTFSR